MLRLNRRHFIGGAAAAVSLPAFMGQSFGQAAQTLTYIQGSDVANLDPAKSQSVTSQIIFRHVFNGLVKWSDGKMSSIVPDLATGWESSEDGLTWTFKLREGIKFHDGEAFDAESVKFNIERLMAEATGSPVRSQFGAIKDITVEDAQTVTLNMSAPFPTLLELLVDEYGAMNSPKAVRELGEDYATHPTGTGPYIFREWVPNDYTRIERNPDYFGTAGIPEAIVVRPIPEGAARVIEIESGNAQIAGNIPPESAPQLEQRDDTRLLVVPSSFQIFFELNTTAEPFNDVRMRQAASLAIDRKAIVDQILGGYGLVPTSPFPAGMQGRVEFDAHPYDPQRAQELIAEVYPNGFAGTIVIWTPAGRYAKDREVAEAVQAYLNAVGLKTEFRTWEWAAYQRDLYAAQEGGTGRGTNPASMWLLGTGVTNADLRLRRKVVKGDPSNLTGYSNPEVQELMTSALTELDYDARMGLYGKVQEILWNTEPNNLPLFDQVQIFAVRENVTDPVVFADEIVLFDQVTQHQ
jgi:ABC-type transport system substrate-binding protein